MGIVKGQGDSCRFDETALWLRPEMSQKSISATILEKVDRLFSLKRV